MERYRITLTPDGRKFGILDRERYEYCGLPREDGTVEPLEWTVRAAAEAWLHQCFRLWNAWEEGGANAGTPPTGWRRRPRQTSPWDRGIRYYD